MERSFAPRLPHPGLDPRRAAAEAAAAVLAPLRAHRRVRTVLLCAALALALLAGGWLMLRRSSLVAVENVQLSGVAGPQSAQIEAALRTAARSMTTLAVDPSALRAAVAGFPEVRSLSAHARFPHGLLIEVREQLPVAALSAGGVRTAVAADGVALGPALLTGALPSVSALVLPRPGHSVGAADVLAELEVLGAAPRALERDVARVYRGPDGLTLAMRNGLLVYFGGAPAARAKWTALVRVLADPGSAGAAYVDVRLPARPVAGYRGASAPPPAAAAAAAAGQSLYEPPGAEPVSTSEATIVALAEALKGGIAQGSTQAPAAAAPTEPQASGGAGEQGSAGNSGAGEAGASPVTQGGGATPAQPAATGEGGGSAATPTAAQPGTSTSPAGGTAGP